MSTQEGYADIPVVAEAYDHIEAYRLRGDVPFFVEEAQRSGGPVLELACGTGRVLVPIARTGVEIVGLDSSDLMLAECRRKLANEPSEVVSRVELHLGDMRSFNVGRQFRLIIVPFNSFLHLTTMEDQLACLRAVRDHLADGGRLILDIFHPHMPLLLDEARRTEVGVDPSIALPDGRTVSRLRRDPHVDFANQIITSEAVYSVVHLDGREETVIHRFVMRYMFRWELEHLLARAGLGVEAIYADFERTPFGSKEPSLMITVARRVG